MTTGIEIFDANGKLQFNGDMMTYALRATGNAYVSNTPVGNSSPTSLTIPVSYADAFVALGAGNGYAAAYAGSNGSSNRRFATGSAPAGTMFEYYVFQRSDQIPPANFGLEVYNSAGALTFSSNQRPMRIPSLIGSPAPQGEYASPSFTASGRKLAFCQAGFAGHRMTYNYLSAGGPNDAWEANQDNPYHGWTNDGKLYGGYITDNGQTVTSGLVSWDDVFIGPTTDPYPGPDTFWPLSLFVVDVTGVPIGQTFF